MISPVHDVPGADPLLLDSLNRLSINERSFLTQLPGQRLMGLQMGSYVKANTTTFEDWYIPGLTNSSSLTTTAWAVNTIYAVPFVAEHPYRLDAMAFIVTTGGTAGAKGRIGIYEAQKSGTGLYYPGALVKDCGDVDTTSTGVKSVSSLAIELTEGALYFAAYWAGTAAATIRSVPAAAMYPTLGFAATLPASPQAIYGASSTYSATAGLPGTYPSGATAASNTAPAIFLRFFAVSEKVKPLPVFFPATNGYTFRRARLVTADGTLNRTKKDYWFTVGLGIRVGSSVSIIDTFDSRKNSLQPGVPYTFCEQDRDLSPNDVVEVYVTRYGEPAEDLSHIFVQTDVLATGTGG